MKKQWMTAITVLALLAAACGDGDDQQARADADATDAGVVDPGPDDAPEADQADQGGCPLDPATVSAAVELEMVPLTTASCALEAVEPGQNSLLEVYYTRIDDVFLDASEGEEIPGIGEAARWDTQMSNSLLVRDSHGSTFSLQVLAMGMGLPEGTTPKGVAVRVAEVILGER